MIIFGAGLAGCLAGSIFQDADIFEAQSEIRMHKAVLRFRSDNISQATGIPFKKIKIYKGIWHNDQSVTLTPRAISLYSRKVSDTIGYRSICNQETEYRWVAPDNLHELLLEQCKNRITYNAKIDKLIETDKIISTIPINILANYLGKKINISKNIQKIFVSRYEIPDCNVWMTYYYTDPTVKPYRASISGNILIIESLWQIDEDDVKTIKRSFGLTGLELKSMVENYEQPNGKMTKIDEKVRKNFIVKATLEYGIYSLGRFATWRNLVLDDVYNDIVVIKKLINKDIYDYHKELI